MSLEFYRSKELLSTLIEVNGKIKHVIEKNCPDTDLVLSEDIDAALEDFLQLDDQDVADNNVAYLSSQLALLHLNKEIERAIEVIVEVNDLRAYYDFNSVKMQQVASSDKPVKEAKSKNLVLISWTGMFCLVAVLFLWIFRTLS